MIKRIKLRNFQAHKDTSMELDPGYNVIIGKSGTAKTSIIRAIRGLFYNAVKQGHVRLPDSEQLEIECHTLNNKIQRQKGRAINSYILDGTVFQDIGTDIPEGVSKALELKAIGIGDSDELDIHFSSQLDSPFLLSETDSFKSKFLNRLSGAHIIDQIVKSFNTDIRANNQRSRELTSSLSEFTLEKDKAAIDTLSKALTYIHSEHDRIKGMEAKLSSLKQIQVKYKQWQSKFEQVERLGSACDRLNLEGFLFSINRYELLIELKRKYISLQTKLNDTEATDATLQKVNPQTGIDQIQKLQKLLALKGKQDYFQIQEGYYNSILAKLDTVDYAFVDKALRLSALYRLKQSMTNIETQLEQGRIKESEYESQCVNTAQAYVAELERQGICPTCGQRVDKGIAYGSLQ